MGISRGRSLRPGRKCYQLLSHGWSVRPGRRPAPSSHCVRCGDLQAPHSPIRARVCLVVVLCSCECICQPNLGKGFSNVREAGGRQQLAGHARCGICRGVPNLLGSGIPSLTTSTSWLALRLLGSPPLRSWTWSRPTPRRCRRRPRSSGSRT